MNTRLSVSWGAYQKNICNGFSFLQQRGEFVDMTLAADGHHVLVHKMVLCLVSPYIKELVAATQCAHPVIFLNNVSSATLENILEYAYTGEALVPRDKIKDFLQACKSLHIKGLEHTSTVELHRESEQSMCQETNDTQCVEEEVTLETSYDDGGHNDLFINNNDELMEITNDGDGTKIVTDKMKTEEEKPKLTDRSITTKSSSSLRNNDTQVQYTISNQGHLQIILNRYIYCFNYKRLKTCELVWRCLENKKKCPASISTKDGRVTHRLKAHNHSFADKSILKRLQQGLVYSELSDAQNMLKDKNREANTSSNLSMIKLDADDQ